MFNFGPELEVCAKSRYRELPCPSVSDFVTKTSRTYYISSSCKQVMSFSLPNLSTRTMSSVDLIALSTSNLETSFGRRKLIPLLSVVAVASFHPNKPKCAQMHPNDTPKDTQMIPNG